MINIHMCGVMSVLKLKYFKLLKSCDYLPDPNGLLIINGKVPVSVQCLALTNVPIRAASKASSKCTALLGMRVQEVYAYI